jgi:hypothetical protein
LLPTLLPLLDSQVQSAVPEPAPAPQELPTTTAPDDSGDGSGAQEQREPGTEDNAEQAVTASAAPAWPAAPGAVEDTVVGWWVSRALELAGKRRINTRDREQHARLRDIPPHRYHRVMGPVQAAEVAKLIRGWDDTLDDSTLTRIDLRPERVRAQVHSIAHRELTSPVIDGQVL